MPAPRGYRIVRQLRHRDPNKRGGRASSVDGLTRSRDTLATHLDRYLDWHRVRNSTEGGIRHRKQDVGYFLAWAEERGLFHPTEITRSILESYQRHLYHYRKTNGRPLGVSTQSKRLSSLKGFFSWLCRERVLEANPASELVLPRAEKRLPGHALSIQEIETVLGLPDITDPLGLRDRAILELFYSSGLRRSELVRLELSDLNRDRRTAHIRKAKGYKDRVVPVGARALGWIVRYLDDVRPLLLVDLDEQTLFLSAYGAAYHPDALGRMVSGYFKQADLGIKGGCHLLRHTCATHMLEGGADIRSIQELLGHASLEATAIYTRVSIIHLLSVHAETHPAESRRSSA